MGLYKCHKCPWDAWNIHDNNPGVCIKILEKCGTSRASTLIAVEHAKMSDVQNFQNGISWGDVQV